MSNESHDEIIVDNFAGGGGASLGIYMATGQHPNIAINHDSEAIAMHTANHPDTTHYCENVWDIDPVKAVAGRRVGLAWFSPDCTFHSKARGSMPFRDRNKARRRRGLAWVVIRWAKAVKPRVIILENVEEFQDWGPLTDDGKPCKIRKGLTFHRWKKQLENTGYAVEYRELRASDYGAPTIRKRLFVIARCDGQPIVWPIPTHGPGLIPYRTAADCIDWSLPCPSIFERKKPLAEATLRRIAKGIWRYVIEASEPFIVTYYGDKGRDDFRGQPINEPLRTQTTENRHAVVVPFITEHANASHQRNFSANEPLRTQCAEVKGGHFALVSAFLAKHYSGVVGHGVDKPAGTVTTVDHHSLVTSHMVKLRGSCKDGQSNTKPMPTITAGGLHIGEVRAFLIKYYGTDQDPQLRDPMHTVTTKHRFGLVTVQGTDYFIADIGMRMLQPRELYRAQGFPDNYVIDLMVNGKPLTKTAQVRMCGNSVCPPIAKALVEAVYLRSLSG